MFDNSEEAFLSFVVFGLFLVLPVEGHSWGGRRVDGIGGASTGDVLWLLLDVFVLDVMIFMDVREGSICEKDNREGIHVLLVDSA